MNNQTLILVLQQNSNNTYNRSMKSYARQFDENDSITPRGNKARKTTTRRDSKKQIQELIEEDELILQDAWDDLREHEIYFKENYEDFEEHQEENFARRYFPTYIGEGEESHLEDDWCPCCGR